MTDVPAESLRVAATIPSTPPGRRGRDRPRGRSPPPPGGGGPTRTTSSSRRPPRVLRDRPGLALPADMTLTWVRRTSAPASRCSAPAIAGEIAIHPLKASSALYARRRRALTDHEPTSRRGADRRRCLPSLSAPPCRRGGLDRPVPSAPRAAAQVRILEPARPSRRTPTDTTIGSRRAATVSDAALGQRRGAARGPDRLIGPAPRPRCRSAFVSDGTASGKRVPRALPRRRPRGHRHATVRRGPSWSTRRAATPAR